MSNLDKLNRLRSEFEEYNESSSNLERLAYLMDNTSLEKEAGLKDFGKSIVGFGKKLVNRGEGNMLGVMEHTPSPISNLENNIRSNAAVKTNKVKFTPNPEGVGNLKPGDLKSPKGSWNPVKPEAPNPVPETPVGQPQQKQGFFSRFRKNKGAEAPVEQPVQTPPPTQEPPVQQPQPEQGSGAEGFQKFRDTMKKRTKKIKRLAVGTGLVGAGAYAIGKTKGVETGEQDQLNQYE